MAIKLHLSKETLQILSPAETRRALGRGTVINITNPSDDPCQTQNCGGGVTGYSCDCRGKDFTEPEHSDPCNEGIPPPPTTVRKPTQ